MELLTSTRIETLERIAQALSNEAELLFDLGYKDMASKIWDQVYSIQGQVNAIMEQV